MMKKVGVALGGGQAIAVPIAIVVIVMVLAMYGASQLSKRSGD